MSTSVVVVDAFTDTPFRGNPAAVLVLDSPRNAEWMQSVAAEMNLSETAFCHEADGVWQLRWFTPRVEVDLCGHATLASAHVLATEHGIEGTIRFQTRSGLLASVATDDGILLDFPADSTRRAEAPDGMMAALHLPDTTPVRKGRSDFLVVLANESEIRAIKPHFGLLSRVDCRGVIVTAPAPTEAPYDVVSRFFAPGSGIDEDPVTGSAHTTLSPYWSARFDRDELRFHQASARGGELTVTRVGDRVEIVGRAVTVLRGELLV